jgi:hypothetical protein
MGSLKKHNRMVTGMNCISAEIKLLYLGVSIITRVIWQKLPKDCFI